MKPVFSLRRLLLPVIAVIALMSLSVACHRHDTEGSGIAPERVLLIYSAGFNSLSNYLTTNIAELKAGEYLPPKNSENVLLLASRLPKSYGNYSVPTPTYLIRIYADKKGQAVCDTLSVPGLPENAVMSTRETLHTILNYVGKTWPDCSYGMVFSSHATGWLPSGFYANPGDYDEEWTDGSTVFTAPFRQQRRALPDGAVPYVEAPFDPDSPAVKSLGQDVEGSFSYEITLEEFREASPLHFDYLLFDACLMGGIEVAYEFKDLADLIGFSQTEVLAQGFDYKTMAGTLLLPEGNGPLGVCSDYFARYQAQSFPYNSATVSLVDCRKLEPLTTLCRELFETYREQILAVDPSTVQRYYRFSRHWVYDLEDILVQAGMSEDDKARLEDFVNLFLAETFLNRFKGE